MLGEWGARENTHLIGKIGRGISSMRWCSPPPKSPNLGRFEPPSSTCLSSTAFSAPPAAMAWGCDRESTLSPKSPSQRAPFKIFWRIASNSPGCIGNPRRRPPATSRRWTQFRNTRILQPSSKIPKVHAKWSEMYSLY